MEINIVAALVATLIMFAIGAFWYSLPFQKVWGRIHGFDKLSKKQQDVLMKQMAPIYGVQLFVTIVTAFVLTYVVQYFHNSSPLIPVFLIWLGFVMPSQVSAVLFSRTESGYKLPQILIMSGESLVRLLATAWVIMVMV